MISLLKEEEVCYRICAYRETIIPGSGWPSRFNLIIPSFS